MNRDHQVTLIIQWRVQIKARKVMRLLEAYILVHNQLSLIKVALPCWPHEVLYFCIWTMHSSKDTNDDMNNITLVIIQQQINKDWYNIFLLDFLCSFPTKGTGRLHCVFVDATSSSSIQQAMLWKYFATIKKLHEREVFLILLFFLPKVLQHQRQCRMLLISPEKWIVRFLS